VVAGAGDGICAGIGAGSVAVGRAYNYLGTTSWVANTTTGPVLDPEMRVFTFAHAIEGLYHPMGTMQTAGAAADWFCETTLGHIADKAAAYRRLDELVLGSPPGSRGLVFLPYLLGERSPWWNNSCTAGWYGLRIGHTLGDKARSVLEGVANNLALIAEALSEFAPFQTLLLLGGGGLSAHWPQILCDAFAMPLHVLTGTESVTARGAAIIAGVGCGLFPDFSVASGFTTVAKTLRPFQEHVDALRRSRERLVDVFGRLFEEQDKQGEV
jgi:xylulokinase